MKKLGPESLIALVTVAALILSATQLSAQDFDAGSTLADLPHSTRRGLSDQLFLVPEVRPAPASVEWNKLMRSSLRFLALEHAFRCATEQGTRDGFSGPFIRGYLNAVGNLHGWADGDPFYVNYVGHPMQGAVSSFIWSNSDPRFFAAYSGSGKQYWKAKLRGTAFAFAHSAQFEIGVLSEASIGKIQAKFPQQGLVDYVVTPTIGLGWVLAEDTIDRYLVIPIESRTANVWLRLLVRSGFNPARTMANVMSLQAPWHRNDRTGVLSPVVTRLPKMRERNSDMAAAPTFDFAIRSTVRSFLSDTASGCLGGEGTAAIRVHEETYVLLNVGGCKLLALTKNVTGDVLDYGVGLRWTQRHASRWNPRAEFIIGGSKMTEEHMDPALKQVLILSAQASKTVADHDKYAPTIENNSLSLRAGFALDLRINAALSFQLAGFDVSHRWASSSWTTPFNTAAQLSSGLVVRFGTW